MQPTAAPVRLPGMNTTRTLRRATAAAAALAACLSGAVLAAPQTADAASEQRAVPKTAITFEVPGCDGCEVGLIQGRWNRHSQYGIRYWDTAQKTVEDGTVTFTVPTKHTKGMSMTVVAPWEGHTGYITTVAFRYGGQQPGDEVGFAEARSKGKGSACWAGTDAEEITIPLTVRKVWVEGVRHHVRGSIAYASTTQDWMVPMRDVWDGVMGSQDVNVCGARRG